MYTLYNVHVQAPWIGLFSCISSLSWNLSSPWSIVLYFLLSLRYFKCSFLLTLFFSSVYVSVSFPYDLPHSFYFSLVGDRTWISPLSLFRVLFSTTQLTLERPRISSLSHQPLSHYISFPSLSPPPSSLTSLSLPSHFSLPPSSLSPPPFCDTYLSLSSVWNTHVQTYNLFN